LFFPLSASEVDIGVDGAKSEIKVKRRNIPEYSAVDFAESVMKIDIVGIVVIVIGARAYIGMPVCNNDILVVQHQSQMREGEPRGSKRRYDTMLGFVSIGRDRDPVTEGLKYCHYNWIERERMFII